MHATWIHRFGTEICLAASAAGLVVTCVVLKPITAGSLSLCKASLAYGVTPQPEQAQLKALGILAARTVQLSMLQLEVLVAVLALTIVACLIGPRMRPRILGYRGVLVCAIALVGGVAWQAHGAYGMTQCETLPRGFLGQLLTSIPYEREGRLTLAWTKGAGEISGVVLAVAAASLVAFSSRPSRAELAVRYVLFQRLLYISSFLFVVGTLVSRANFAWVVAHWDLPKKELSDAASALVTAGVTHVSIGYSAMLAAAFIPLRLLLDSHLNAHVPKAEQQEWFSRLGLSATWQNDVRQLLGLLAPIIAAPIFDVVAKL